jgi:YEATS domain-containing protein 4
MPAPAGTKRVRGVQVFRPFMYGTEAIPFDPANRPKDAPPDHTHRWKVFVRGINNEDISYWLRKVQFKLHDTYANSVRMIESPPFEVEETGWGEFEIAIKFYFVPESTEKPQQIWHGLKLHPYYGDIEMQKRERKMISSVCYEEVLFNEPVEAFYEILTGGGQPAKSKAGKAGKGGKGVVKPPPTAEIPMKNAPGNKFSREEESKELDRLGEAVKTVQKLIAEEKTKLTSEEAKLQELEKTEGKPIKKK